MIAHPNQVSASTFWIGESWTARGLLTAAAVMPITYSLALSFLLLDVWVQLYQAAAFRLLGISRVRRRDYIMIDRHRLPYLTTIQKANCVYCGYINGLLAFVREVAGRTEQFWCPIRHARRARGQHRRHRRFAPYGDGDAFRRVAPALRAELLDTGKQARRRRTE